MKRLPPNTALIVVDVQIGFDDPKWGKRNNPSAEKNIAELIKLWRETKRPVIHVQHMSDEPDSPLRPDSPGNAFKLEAQPAAGERIEHKTVNSSFIGTQLEEHLRASNIGCLVVVGLTTDHCVSTTTRMARNLGFEAYLVSDATATFNRAGFDGRSFSADEIHATALASLHNEFATVADTQTIVAEGLGLSATVSARPPTLC